MLVRIFYLSEIVEPVTAIDMQVVLGAAQIRNRRLDVTGMLAQSDGHFAQVLEGRREAVDEIMARVVRDSMHRDVRVFLDEPITHRQFARWSMGLVRRDDMADEMRTLYAQGAASVEEIHGWIDRLLRFDM